jgi:hypothetical protein
MYDNVQEMWWSGITLVKHGCTLATLADGCHAGAMAELATNTMTVKPSSTTKRSESDILRQ